MLRLREWRSLTANLPYWSYLREGWKQRACGWQDWPPEIQLGLGLFATSSQLGG
jgi:hypothetical protein